jgi:hypothetical protein
LAKRKHNQSYYEHDYESFLAVLKKNRKKLAIDPARRGPAEAVWAEFEGSVSKLGPLLEWLERTDRLIEAVGYRLYDIIYIIMMAALTSFRPLVRARARVCMHAPGVLHALVA